MPTAEFSATTERDRGGTVSIRGGIVGTLGRTAVIAGALLLHGTARGEDASSPTDGLAERQQAASELRIVETELVRVKEEIKTLMTERIRTINRLKIRIDEAVKGNPARRAAWEKEWNARNAVLQSANASSDLRAFAGGLPALDERMSAWIRFVGQTMTAEESPTWQSVHVNLQSTFNVLEPRVKELRENANTYRFVDPESGRAIREVRNPDKEGSFSRHYAGDEGAMREEYSQNRLDKRLLLDEQGNVKRRETNFYMKTGQRVLVTTDEYTGKEFREMHRKTFWQTGELRGESDRNAGSFDYFNKRGRKLLEAENSYDQQNCRYFMIGADGKRLGNYLCEKGKNAKLTTDEYLTQLANVLRPAAGDKNPYEPMAVFFMYFMKYMEDGANGDHWQQAAETLTRIVNGRMLGDCEDYSLLAQAILAKWNIPAHIVTVPKHATCMWTHGNERTGILACSMCSYRLDINGNIYDENDIDYHHLPKERTADRAIHLLLKKFEQPTVSLPADYRLNAETIAQITGKPVQFEQSNMFTAR